MQTLSNDNIHNRAYRSLFADIAASKSTRLGCNPYLFIEPHFIRMHLSCMPIADWEIEQQDNLKHTMSTSS